MNNEPAIDLVMINYNPYLIQLHSAPHITFQYILNIIFGI